MNCREARKLIDRRIHEEWAASVPRGSGATERRPSRSEEPGPEPDWSALDAHLAQCPKCQADYAELSRTRKLLADVTADGPTDEEIESMWTAIHAAQTTGAVIAPRPTQRTAFWPFLAASIGTAALLLLAFQLGDWRLGESSHAPTVATVRPSPSRARLGSGFPETARMYENAWTLSTVNVRPSSDEEASASKDGKPEQRRGGLALGDKAVRMGLQDSEKLAPRSFGYGVLDSRRGAGVVGHEEDGLTPQKRERVESLGYVGPDSHGEASAVSEQRGKDVVGQEMSREGLSDSDGDGITLGSKFEPTPPPEIANVVETTEGVELAPAETAEPAGELGERYGEYGRGQEHRGDAETSGRGVQPATEESVPPQPAPQPAPRPEAKIIKTGELGFEVEVYESAVERVYAIVRQHGAFVADGSTQEQAGGALTGRIVIRVPPERFEALFAALKAIGRLEAENVKVADVTAEYVDLEARIKSLTVTEERLRELMKSKSFMDKITSLLEVERELTRVRSQIEQLQGQLRVMADRVAMSTITVTLREPARTVPSASMSVEVPTLDEAADALGATLETLGGQLLSGKTSKRNDGTLMGNYTLRISLAHFGDLLRALELLGRVEERQVKDRQFGDAAAPWSATVQCSVALVLYERSRQLPSGMVQLEVDALAPSLEALTQVLADRGGSIISNRTTRRDDGSSVANLSIRVPAGKFATLLDALAPIGRTTAKTVEGEAGRIVGGAANVLCNVTLTLSERPREVPSGFMALEVKSFPEARETLSAYVAQKGVQVLQSSSRQRTDGTWIGTFRLGIRAADMEPVVSRLESLGRVESREIQGLGLGDLSKTDPDALGVIEMTLAESAAFAPPRSEAGAAIRDRLRDGLAGLYASLGLILYGLVFLAPWLVVVLLLAWVITRLWRRRQQAKPAASAPPAQGAPPVQGSPPGPTS